MLDEDAIRIGVLATHLDEIDYYTLLEIPRDATGDEVRDAFHAFALRFHPDRHVGEPAQQKNALAIFKRGAEAYRVLKQPTLRSRYDEGLAKGTRRLPADAMRPDIEPASSTRGESFPAGSRVFFDKAREAMRRSDFGGARMHLALAMSRGESQSFTDLAAEIRAAEQSAKK